MNSAAGREFSRVRTIRKLFRVNDRDGPFEVQRDVESGAVGGDVASEGGVWERRG